MKCVKVGCLSEFKSRKYPVASNARNHNSKAGRRGEWLQVVQPDVSFNSGCLCYKCEQTFLEWLTLQTPDDEEAFTALAEAVNMKSFKAIAEVWLLYLYTSVAIGYYLKFILLIRQKQGIKAFGLVFPWSKGAQLLT